eukprot:CAMPEP_0176007712 /NCGR_PEP_ID=MMETSP0120_2-20121206/3372_1 /TAXON_ID=160619 /ORGANISM="Kryptoperidinium foliaceum, Strain CCMP 1326" /LENGTH=224 /DNA_ID=CAMNT_0017340477 /DNA_START=88 /DNA_END=759 /DNA_ORIENTATION=+
MVRGAGTWLDGFAKLREFHAEHGHCVVEKQKDRTLYKWIIQQRKERRQDRLSAERIEKLDNLGFEWAGTREANQEVLWDLNFNRLSRYCEEHGLGKLKELSEYDKVLATWASNQRKINNRGMLREDRKQRLVSIGFDFGKTRKNRPQKISSSQQERWERMYQRLLGFKKEYGHVDVPYYYEKDKALALWVTTQRREYKSKSWYGDDRSIRDDRKSRLEDVGFVW